MNIKLLIVITILSICFILGFEKISYGLNKTSSDNIAELEILRYMPKDNKTFFISNTKSSKIANNIRKNYETKEKDNLVLVKNSILAYLGIDLGTNKLEDIYNDELTITTYEKKGKDIDDILIIFKIKDKKDIDDILNLTNKIYEPDKLIKIFRENKLNYLKYIYQTNDNYILTSSNKKLILEALQSSITSKRIGTNYELINKVLKNSKNEHNILLTKNFKKNELLNNENYPLRKKDYLLTLFDFKDKKIISKSYLINNYQSLDIMSYEKIDKENILDKKNYQISIYNNLLNSNNFIDPIKINSFEKTILKEINEKSKENNFFLVSDKNWIVIFDNNDLSIENIQLLKDFNKYSINNNDITYTIYSKDILKKEDNIIKKDNYKNIFSAITKNLTFFSNSLINEADIDLISKQFFNFQVDSNAKYFLNKQINLNNLNSIQPINASYLENINYFFKKIINLSIIKFNAIIKQSIPETTPIYYAETNLKIF